MLEYDCYVISQEIAQLVERNNDLNNELKLGNFTDVSTRYKAKVRLVREFHYL